MAIAVEKYVKSIEVGIILSAKEEYINEFKPQCMYHMADMCSHIYTIWANKPVENFKSEDHFGYITEWMNNDIEGVIEAINIFKEKHPNPKY